MGINRFKQFIRFVRFDDFRTRAERQNSDRLAAFSDVWKLFLSELNKHYIPDADIIIDEHHWLATEEERQVEPIICLRNLASMG